MDILVTLPGGQHVDALVGTHLVRTDQPVAAGGEDSAVAPFDLFLASLATCAGFYVNAYCRTRGIPTDGIRLRQRTEKDDKGRLARVAIAVELPPDFPSQHRDAVVRAAATCKVKKVLADPPAIDVTAVTHEPAAVGTQP